MEVSDALGTRDAWDVVWHTFGNASLCYDLISSQNVTKYRTSEEIFHQNPARVGVATGILIACIANSKLTTLKNDITGTRIFDKSLSLKTMCFVVSNFACFCLLAPFATFGLTILYAYRSVVETLLKIQLRDKFLGLLEGTDCVWALENSSSLSVINVLAVLERNNDETDSDLMNKLRVSVKSRLMGRNPVFEKLSSLRNKRYGYFYWERCDSMRVENHVRWLYDETTNSGSTGDTGERLNNILSDVCNEPLPLEHKTCWEILVGRSDSKPRRDHRRGTEEGIPSGIPNFREKAQIPIVFRVHHALGDGVALLRLLLESFADSDRVREFGGTLPATIPNDERELSMRIRSKLPIGCEFATLGKQDFDVADRSDHDKNERVNIEVYGGESRMMYRKDLLSAAMPFIPLFALRRTKDAVRDHVLVRLKTAMHLSFRNMVGAVPDAAAKALREIEGFMVRVVYENIHRTAKVMSTLIMTPGCLVHQALRSMDDSALHGPKLSGDKFVSCWMESDSKNEHEPKLLTRIQEVKNATGTKFGDVVLAALSSSLHRYFGQIGEYAPETLTVVVPARMSAPNEDLRLENGFSVGLLSLCVSGTSVRSADHANVDPTTMERLFDVAMNSDKLKNGPDYMVNFWVMRWLSAALPEVLLRPLLESNSTLIFSNLPGPREVDILGYRLRNVAFWVPHRSSTGIGVSVLSYGGRIHLALVADKAIVRDDRLFAVILENTVREIENLHDSIFSSHFARSRNDTNAAPTDKKSESCNQDERERFVIVNR